MKKITIVSIMSFIFLTISSLVAYFLRYVDFNTALTSLAIGLGILLFSGLIAIFAKKITGLNIICFLLSAVALGFCIRAWYIFRNFDNSFFVMLLVSLACIAYLWVFYILAHTYLCEKYFTVFFWLYFILSFIAYIFVVIYTQTTYVSTFGYYMLIEMSFIFALCAESTNVKDLIRALTISTYSVFAVAIIILLSMHSGDLDFDINFDLFSIKDKKSIKEQELDFY